MSWRFASAPQRAAQRFSERIFAGSIQPFRCRGVHGNGQYAQNGQGCKRYVVTGVTVANELTECTRYPYIRAALCKPPPRRRTSPASPPGRYASARWAKSGFSLRDISDAIGLSRGAVGDLAVGRNQSPKGDAALALDALHREHCVRRQESTRAGLAALRREHRGHGQARRALLKKSLSSLAPLAPQDYGFESRRAVVFVFSIPNMKEARFLVRTEPLCFDRSLPG